MSEPSSLGIGSRSGLGGLRGRMRPRSPSEGHRTATPLELFFDLVVVVAVAQAASGLHHAISQSHAAAGVVGYLMVFFAIWWAWINFTWFASAYDCDDVPYRLAVLLQMAGALIMAAGVPSMLETRTPNAAIISGYVVMRLAMVSQWLRASLGDPAHRTTARRYALGIAVLQLAWVSMPLIPSLWMPGFLVLAGAELLVPVWAERSATTPWHPHHIAERYGLFTLIVLGESILAATIAVQSALSSGDRLAVLVPTIVGGILIVYSLWWMYFERPVHDLLSGLRKAIIWGYGHYLVFAAAAGVGAGLAVAVDVATHHSEVSTRAAGFAVAIPAAIYLSCLWVLHYRPDHHQMRSLGPSAALLVLLTPFTPYPVPLTGLILAAVVAIKLIVHRQMVSLVAAEHVPSAIAGRNT